MTTTRRGSAGTLLGGRYRLIEPLPGAGRTWRTEDETDGRALLARAVELPDGLPETDRQQARQQALRDAAVVARVQHPGIAPVVDAVVEDGAAWVISERPPGRSLGEIVSGDGPVSPDAAALVGMQVLEALVAAGVPHGELTPHDVVIADNGQVRVTGFATTPLGAVGTRGFAPPEGGPGPAADLWALGVTLHVAVEGRLPNGARPRAGALGPALDALLNRDPDRRTDLATIRRLLVDAAGEPDAPAPPASDLQDPEVMAALAAFNVAVGGSSAPAGASSGRKETAQRTSAAAPVANGRAAALQPMLWAVPLVRQPRPGLPAAATPEQSPAAPIGRTPRPAGPVQQTPVQQTPAQQTSPPATPVQQTPPQQTPARQTPAQQTPAQQTPAQQTPAQQTPAQQTPAQQTPAQQTSPPATPVRQTPAQQTPAQQTPPPAPAQEAAAGAEFPPPAAGSSAARTGSGRKRVLLGVAVAAVLALLAILVPFLLNRDGDARPSPAAQPTAVSPVTSTAPDPTDTTPSPDTPIPPPSGWQLYKDPAGWSIAVPVGWDVARRGTAVTFTKDDRTLRVTGRADPPKDPYDAALKLQPVIEAATPGYDFVRIATVSYRGWPTTDYEFRAGGATKTHSLFRTTVPNPRQVFDIAWTCLDREWMADRAIFDTAMQTFDPGA